MFNVCRFSVTRISAPEVLKVAVNANILFRSILNIFLELRRMSLRYIKRNNTDLKRFRVHAPETCPDKSLRYPNFSAIQQFLWELLKEVFKKIHLNKCGVLTNHVCREAKKLSKSLEVPSKLVFFTKIQISKIVLDSTRKNKL